MQKNKAHKLNIVKEDTVIVISGKDKGKKGRVLHTYPRENRILVEGVNMVKKHARPSQQNPQGGILNQEAPIHASNVMLVDPKSGEPTRVGFKVNEDGEKVRIARKSGEVIKKAKLWKERR